MLAVVSRVAVLGAGAMGTALAIHLGRMEPEVALWGSEFDERVLPQLREGTHPALPERLPPSVRVFGPEELDDAAKGAEIAVMGAHSKGARSLARIVKGSLGDVRIVVSIAKGLEPGSLARMSEVYGGELDGRPVVAVGGPALAPEVAEGQPCVAAFACVDAEALDEAAGAFRGDGYGVRPTDDCAGVEYCGTAKNVGAIGSGIVEGLAQQRDQEYRNARSAIFARAASEMADLVEALGGRRDTALGLAGIGDLLVTSLGGRNRQYGLAIGAGSDPRHALEDMQRRGMTVEGVESARDVHDLAGRSGLELPVHEAVYRVVHEGSEPETMLEVVG